MPGKISFALVAACLLAVAVPRVAPAQNISIDGRFSPAQTLSAVGGNYSIGANLGKQVGSNLFQSFGKFGLSTGETAAFSGPATINNVIGRVTGGNLSSIDGKIQSTIAGANLYLINPSGIVFGPNATVDVKGSFQASTADYLKLSDGARFQATNPDASTFSAASPVAFGFLTATPAAITINGSTLAQPATPAPVPANLGLVAGPVTITGGTLRAPAGTIQVTGVAGMGEVPVDPRNTAALTVTSFAPVGITNRSLLTASTPAGPGSGGSVFIRAGALTIDASTVAANNSGSGPGGQLVLRGDSQVTLSNGAATNGAAAVQAVAQGGGSGAGVTISTAPTGVIRVDASTLTVGSSGSGNGGALLVQTGQLTFSNGALFTSIAQAGGNGSLIAITADSMLVNGSTMLNQLTGISSTTSSAGNGGRITITAGSVVLDGGATQNLSTGIFSTTSSTASNAGPGGAISIVAGELVFHNRANMLAGSCLTPTCGAAAPGARLPAGAGGAVAVMVGGSLTIDSGASLGTVAGGTGNAGNVSVMAAGPVAIERSVAPVSSILDGIGSLTQGAGNAGNVTVTAGALTITTDGLVSSLTAQGAAGRSGSVAVNVSGMLSIDGSGGIQGFRTGILGDTFSSGRGGDVTVTAGSITIAGGACAIGGGTCSGQISSSAFGRGNSGSVSVGVAGGLTIDGAMTPSNFITGITSQGSTGNAGTVAVNGGSISIVNSGTISSETFGPGDGGSVSVNVAGALTIDGAMTPGSFTGISSQANRGSSGNAGTVSVSAGGISLANFGRISSLTFGPQQAGRITVAAGALSLTSKGAITSSTLGSGTGGSVSVAVAGQLSIDGALGDPSSLTGISSQTQGGGAAGTVTVTAGALTIARNSAISSNTFGSGTGGSVSVTVAGQLAVDGTAAASSLTGIATNSEFGSTADAGNVAVTAGTLSLVNGGAISSSAIRPDNNLPASTGNAGSVSVNVAGPLSLSGSRSRIVTNTEPGTTGKAGSVAVTAPQIAIASGAEIGSTTAGTGAGGSVMVTTPGTLVLNGNGDPNTQIAASATGPQSGPGGTVTVQANALTIEGGAQIASSTAGPGKGGDVNVTVASDIVLPDPGPQITAQSTGSGDAGSITLSAVRLLMNNGAKVSTEAETSTANGGNITLHLRDFLYLVSSEISTSVKGETGNGGNIAIDPQLVILNHSSIIAQAIEGHGGNITITAGQFIPSSDSIVSASSELGISGTVVINGPRVDVNGALVVLSSQLRGRTEVLREACAARADRPISSLVEAGRGGLPQDPEATLPALYIAGRDLNPQPGTDTVEPSGTALHTTARLTMRCS
jgi:filamentous hemagglutinin family protein